MEVMGVAVTFLPQTEEKLPNRSVRHNGLGVDFLPSFHAVIGRIEGLLHQVEFLIKTCPVEITTPILMIATNGGTKEGIIRGHITSYQDPASAEAKKLAFVLANLKGAIDEIASYPGTYRVRFSLFSKLEG